MHLAILVPRPVPVLLGGQHWLAAEYRISDLADLQEWLNARSPSPYEAESFEIHYSDRTIEWKRRLKRVLAAQEAWPVDLAEACGDPATEAYQVYLALRRYSPELDPAHIAELIESASAFPITLISDLSKILRIAWGADPIRAIVALIDGPTVAPVDPPDWAAIYHRYLTEVSGPAPRFEDLTLSQFRSWATKGKSAEENRADCLEVAERRTKFWEEIEE